MTTQQSTPSPFSTDIKTDNIPYNLPTQQNAQSDFEMRTMKEDLAKIQASGIVMEKKPAPAKTTASQPIKAPQPQKPQLQTQPQSEIVKKSEIEAEKITSFPQQEATNVSSMPSEEIIHEIPVPAQANKSNKPAAIKIVAVIIVLLIVSIIALGAYYFYITKRNNSISEADLNLQPSVEQNQTEEQQPKEITEEINEPEETAPIQKYSEQNPNYLVVDISNTDQSAIKNAFQKAADELKEVPMTSPYEFLVVDANNNPISFTAFATAAKLNFSQATLSNMGNNFTVYFYNDNSNVRVGLAVDSISKEKLTKEIAAQEKNLERDISFLFLNDMAPVKGNPFASSTYGNYPIRYSNIDSAKNLSIDYSITDSKFIISTSKNTERAVIDKVFTNSKQSDQNDPSSDLNAGKQNISSQTKDDEEKIKVDSPSTTATTPQ